MAGSRKRLKYTDPVYRVKALIVSFSSRLVAAQDGKIRTGAFTLVLSMCDLDGEGVNEVGVISEVKNREEIDEEGEKNDATEKLVPNSGRLGDDTADVNWTCDVCDATHETQDQLRSHILDNHAVEFTCADCQLTFLCQEKLQNHLCEASASSGSFFYANCPKTFANQRLLDRHTTCHDASGAYYCETCHACFATRPAMTDHSCRCEDGEAFRCEICGDRFVNELYLLRHLAATHETITFDIARYMERYLRVQILKNPEVEEGSELPSAADKELDNSPAFETDNIEMAGSRKRLKYTDPVYRVKALIVSFSSRLVAAQDGKIRTGAFTLELSMCDLDGEGVNEDQLRSHILDNHAVEFTCADCQLTFLCQEKLQNHLCEASASSGSFFCADCPKTFANQRLLDRHTTCHDASGAYYCETCHACFATRTAMTDHSCRCEDGEAFRCEICGDRFVNELYLLRHLAATHERRFACATWRRRTSGSSHAPPGGDTRAEVRMRHLAATHERRAESREAVDGARGRMRGPALDRAERGRAEPGVEAQVLDQVKKALRPKSHLHHFNIHCKKCNVVSPTRPDFVAHLRNVHGTFTRRKQKNPEVEEGSELPSAADKELDNSPATQDQLRVHILDDHAAEFTCADCQLMFLCQEKLQNHLCEASASSGSFFCADCPKTFANQRLLDRHTTCHDASGAYYCETCHACFATRTAMTDHSCRCEDGEAFRCEICGDRFVNELYLLRHLAATHERRSSHAPPGGDTRAESGVSRSG
ncbi:PREDICTED: oocyte zinc finger protein XlCOF6-like [Priapulus caudatus]|uniref:Oocyte zinc finger protein XlCOF6-like n=1 Tax=Priapulus caudatus TaxID=37621 RepID=A0ABM1F600_PRICU|nr:PREDICTED: oocyte zinc finger protein XlCOF6-like [Priapulus caudatus]